jgi:hypothetical protein
MKLIKFQPYTLLNFPPLGVLTVYEIKRGKTNTLTVQFANGEIHRKVPLSREAGDRFAYEFFTIGGVKCSMGDYIPVNAK